MVRGVRVCMWLFINKSKVTRIKVQMQNAHITWYIYIFSILVGALKYTYVHEHLEIY